MITLYFKRFFTQTIHYVYKISYLVACKIIEKNQGDHESTEAKILENISKMDDIKIDSAENNNSSQLNSQKSKAAKSENEQPSTSFFVEIWLSWNFLHVKSKYQNLVLIEKVRKSLVLIRQADFNRTFDVTSFMLNPPEILKLKEPLFKISVANPMIESSLENDNNIYNRNKVNNLVFSIENLNYELNMRSSKITTDQFIEFAQSWVHLSFDKYNKNIMGRHFGFHNLKLVLNYDRPLPDTSSVLFDMKNMMVLIMKSSGNKSVYYDNLNCFNDNSLLSQEYLTTLNNLGYANALNQNQNTSSNNIFQCKISLTKLCAMLTEWSDIMLVENCVYLKYLTSSSSLLKLNNKKSKQKASGIFCKKVFC